MLSLVVFLSPAAKAQEMRSCIEKLYSRTGQPALGITPREIDVLVYQVAAAVGLDPRSVVAVECDTGGRVESHYIAVQEPQDIRPGSYIAYDPVWVREMFGPDIRRRVPQAFEQAVVLIGHELGHFANSHFTTNSNWDRIRQETDADRFAGCASAVMRTSWTNVSDFLSRLRGDFDSFYPSRTRSLAAAKLGFEQCSNIKVTAPPTSLYRRELKVAVLANDARAVRETLGMGASPQAMFDGNIPAVTFAWAIGAKEAFWALLAEGGTLPKSEEYNRLILDLVLNVRTPPSQLQMALRAGAPVRDSRVLGKPACVAKRPIFRDILKTAGYVC
jgi:hypothetical protein